MATTAWASIREAVRAIEATIGASGVITQEIGNAIVVNMGSMAEMTGQMNVRMENAEGAMNAIGVAINGEIRSLNDKINNLQNMVDSNRDRQAHRRHGILESKSVQSIKILGSDKGGVPHVE